MPAEVALIHPPGGDPRGPRLALPALQAFLRRQGISARIVDLDVLSLHDLISPSSLARAASVVRAQSAPTHTAADIDRLQHLAARLPQTAPEALSTLRDPVRFYDRLALTTAREIVLDALDLLSAACPRPVHYSLEPLRYEIDGVDATRFADLVRVTADREANLFADYWEEKVLPELEQTRFALFGVSIATRFQLIPGLMLARLLRARGHFVVLGGSLLPRFAGALTKLPDFFDFFADGVMVGDGETALCELVAQLDGARDFGCVPNYLYREDGRVRFTRPHLEDLATLPTPDFTGYPLDRYLVPAPVLPLLIGRGCYHSLCRFCEIPHNHRISAQPFRQRPPELVVADILEVARRFGCRHFVLGDEAIRPEVLERIADGLAAAGRDDLRFAAYLRFEPGFTGSLCRKLARMGLRRVLLGLESGSQRSLDHMRKGTRVADTRPILEGFRSAGVGYGVFAIVGLPEETEDCARETFGFFEQNFDLFDHPGRSYDIRPLSLQVCSPYMQEALELGLRIAPALLAGEFAVGVGRAWENSRGLSQNEISRMLQEYGSRLSRIYGRYDFWPSALWPVWDEWGLLYADHYQDRPYPFRASLPTDPVGEFVLRWNPAVAISEENDTVVVSSRMHSVRMAKPLFAAFSRAGVGSPEALLARLAGGDPPSAEAAGEIRDWIAALVRVSLVQIVSLPDGLKATATESN